MDLFSHRYPSTTTVLNLIFSCPSKQELLGEEDKNLSFRSFRVRWWRFFLLPASIVHCNWFAVLTISTWREWTIFSHEKKMKRPMADEPRVKMGGLFKKETERNLKRIFQGTLFRRWWRHFIHLWPSGWWWWSQGGGRWIHFVIILFRQKGAAEEDDWMSVRVADKDCRQSGQETPRAAVFIKYPPSLSRWMDLHWRCHPKRGAMRENYDSMRCTKENMHRHFLIFFSFHPGVLIRLLNSAHHRRRQAQSCSDWMPDWLCTEAEQSPLSFECHFQSSITSSTPWAG